MSATVKVYHDWDQDQIHDVEFIAETIGYNIDVKIPITAFSGVHIRPGEVVEYETTCVVRVSG